MKERVNSFPPMSLRDRPNTIQHLALSFPINTGDHAEGITKAETSRNRQTNPLLTPFLRVDAVCRFS
jgi:hypothetical protein